MMDSAILVISGFFQAVLLFYIFMCNSEHKSTKLYRRQSPLCPWDSPGKNTGVGSHALLQGILLTQGWNPDLLSQADSLPLSHQGSPYLMGGVM